MTTRKKLRGMKLPPGYNACLLLDAADEIERLRAALNSEPTEAQIEAAADALIDESNRGDWEYDEACRVAAAILRAALAAGETK